MHNIFDFGPKSRILQVAVLFESVQALKALNGLLSAVVIKFVQLYFFGSNFNYYPPLDPLEFLQV